MSTQKLSLNAFFPKKIQKFVGEVLFSSMQLKTSYMSSSGFLDLILKFLEVSEHFSLLPHGIDPGVSRENTFRLNKWKDKEYSVWF